MCIELFFERVAFSDRALIASEAQATKKLYGITDEGRAALDRTAGEIERS